MIPHSIPKGFNLASNLHSYVAYAAAFVGGAALLLIVVAVLLHRRQTSVSVARPGLWAVTGGMGAGKTYFLTWVAWKAIREGRPVFANYHVKGAWFVDSWDSVCLVPDGAVVLLAELQLWWPSDVPYGPENVEAWVHQLRHHGITCLWDSQHYTFVSNRFRKLTFGVWEGRPMAGAHQYTLFDGFNYRADRTNSKTRLARMVVKRIPEVQAMYNTLEDVPANLGWAESRGRRAAVRAGAGAKGGAQD